MIFKIGSALLVLILFQAQAWADDAEAERLDKLSKNVRIFRKSDPPASCKEMENIESPAISVMDDVQREAILRRMAAKKGANAMMVIGRGKDKLIATIFKCK